MREIFKVQGMHCRSCEINIEQEVKKVEGVTRAKANTSKKSLLVEGDGWKPSEIEKAVNTAGYYIGEEKATFFSHNSKDYLNLGLAFLVFFALYAILSLLGLNKIFNFTPRGDASLLLVFGVGLAAGISTCMAVVGGLVLGISARHSEKYPEATPAQKFRPQLFFNGGRIFFYTIFGAVIGLLGGAIRFNPAWNGLLTIIIGVFMIGLAIQISGIIPGLSNIFTLPSGLSKLFGITKEKEYSHTHSFMLGGFTFFLPCGFTQAMQLLAVSSGSAAKGAAIMGIFALGTAPGLLGVGGLASLLKKDKVSNFFYKFIAIVVLGMAFYNIMNGLRLVGYRGHLPKTPPTSSTNGSNNSAATVTPTPNITTPQNQSGGNDSMSVGDIQLFKTTYSIEDYAKTINPNEFTVKVGKPVKIEIYAKDEGFGCMGTVMIPGLVNNYQQFQKGETLTLEFTPDKVGTYEMTCAMGIPSGTIYVVN